MRYFFLVLSMSVFFVSMQSTNASAEPKGGYQTAYKTAVDSPELELDGDYFSVFLETVYLNREPSWLSQNDIAVVVTANIQEGNKSTLDLTTPVYNRLDNSTSTKLGIENYPILTDVPFRGQYLTLKTKIIRNKKSDGIRRIFSFLGGDDSSDGAVAALGELPVLSTYTTTALPYVRVASKLTLDAMDKFTDKEDLLFNHEGITFIPSINSNSGSQVIKTWHKGDADRYNLRDTLILQTLGSKTLDVGALEYDGNTLWVTENGKKRRIDDRPWIVYRIRKSTTRPDYVSRVWYKEINEILSDYSDAKTFGTTQEQDRAKARLIAALSLMRLDMDFTNGQKKSLKEGFVEQIASNGVVAQVLKSSI